MSKDRYRRGAHTVLNLQYHFVWKTKYSYPVLRGDVGLSVRDILRKICSDKDISILKGNVRSDHIHLFVEAPAHLSVSKIAQYLKGISSFRLMQDYPHLKKRYWGSHLWSRGYFCSTAGSMTEEAVKSYIENQDDVPKDFQVWDEERKDLSS